MADISFYVLHSLVNCQVFSPAANKRIRLAYLLRYPKPEQYLPGCQPHNSNKKLSVMADLGYPLRFELRWMPYVEQEQYQSEAPHILQTF
jgi:hypothetical protein